MAIITITGDLASGKSVVAKQLIHSLDATYFSTGQIQRNIAKSMGMTTLELNKYSETHPEIDDQIDGTIKQLAKQQGQFVVDSRMAWHFLPKSFKVYLSVDRYRAAERVIQDDQRSSEPVYSSISEAVTQLTARKQSENKRYLQLYQADCSDMNNFDVVVDSTFSTPEQTLSTILDLVNHWHNHNQVHKLHHFWLSPNYIYPMEPLESTTYSSFTNLNLATSTIGLTNSTPVNAVQVNGRFYSYGDPHQLAMAIATRSPHIPVNILATDQQIITGELTASDYVQHQLQPALINHWSEQLDCTFLPL